jgi:FlaA1/EpsC-like NDP-sugar epimerase
VDRQHVVSRAEPEQQDSESDLQKKFFSSPAEQRRQQPGSGSSSSDQQKQQNIIDNVNPYELGRQARRAFDDVWGQISSLTTPTKSYVFDDILDPSLSLEEEGNESDTTVLVVGATGRVGRILIRKLLLRGYKVKALIRLREGVRESKEDIQGLPSAVEVITGDVGELRHCQKALKGVDKVRAAARVCWGPGGGSSSSSGGGNRAQRD